MTASGSRERELRARGTTQRADLRCLGLLALGYLGLGVVLPIGAELPLGDAWTFAWSARQLVEHGRLVLTDGQAMTLVGQLLLAAPVGLLFSGEPAVLNLFVFFLSAFSAGLFFLCFRRLGLEPATALLATGTLAANPIFLAQSISFDTEIPFLFFSALGLSALLGWDRGGSRALPWLAALAFAAAVTVRQHAVVYGFAGLAYALWSRRERRTPLLPWLLPFAALGGFYLWLHFVHGVPKAFTWSQQVLALRLSQPVALAATMAAGAVVAAHHFGLFALPLLPLARRAQAAEPARRRAARAAAALALLLALGTLLVVLGYGMLMPSLPNVLTLEAVVSPFGVEGPQWGLRLALTAVALGAAVLAIFAALPRLHAALRPRSAVAQASPAMWRFLLACVALLLGFSLVTGLHFERYLLPPLPFLLPVLCPPGAPGPARLAAGAGLVALFLLFSLFFVDQRVRAARCEWEVAQDLLQQTGDPHRIDAGVSFNGYYSYEWLSRSYGAAQQDPWLPGVNPAADLVVRPFALQDPRVEEIAVRRCSNRFGLRPYAVHVYRRSVFGGPPLRTPQG